MERSEHTCAICDSEFAIEHDEGENGLVCFCPFCGEQLFDDVEEEFDDEDYDFIGDMDE